MSNPRLQLVRDVDITAKRLLFSYGPGTGGGPPSPAGVLGHSVVTTDKLITKTELAAQAAIDFGDRTAAKSPANIAKVCAFSLYTRIVSSPF